MGAALPGLTAGLLNQSSAQVIDGSLMFDDGDYLKYTPSSTGNRKTFTLSCWVKRNNFGQTDDIFVVDDYSSSGDFTELRFDSDDRMQLWIYGTSTGGKYETTSPDRRFRDTGWYHIVVAVDSTQANASDRVKYYVNGELYDWTGTSVNIAQNEEFRNNLSGQEHFIGYFPGSTAAAVNLSNFYGIDGQALGPSYFGFTDPLTNTWRPKKYTGTFGSPAVPGTGTLTNYDNNTQFPTYSNQGGGSSTTANILKAFDGDNSTYADMTYLNSQYSRLTFENPITNVTNITIGYDGEGDPGYNGGNHQTSVSFNGSRQTISLYSGGAITLNNLDFISQPGNGVCRLYDVTITTTSQSATELTLSGPIPTTGINSFYLPFDGNSPIGQDKSGQGNDWTPGNFGGSNSIEKATGALPILNTTQGGTQATVGVRTDAYAANLTLALPLVGTKEDVSNQINSGSTTKTVTISGDPASSTLQSNFYGSSFYFDGSANTDYVSVADNDQLDVGSGDFTIECWAYVSGYPNTNPGLLSKRGGNGAAHWQLALNRNGLIQFGDQATWSNDFGTSSGTTGDQIFKDQWHHIAITRTSGSVQAWYDGRKYGTAITNTTDFDTTANFSVGVGRESTYDPFQGYVSDVRVYKGVAKYTGDFVPASTNPDILPDTPSGVSGSSKLAKIADGGVTFDGTADHLEVADSADFTFGDGEWTMEAFVYPETPATARYHPVICKYGSSSATSSWWWAIYSYLDGSSQMFIYCYSGVNQYYNATSTRTIRQNAWNHVAVTRDGNTVRSYINGVESGTIDLTGISLNDSTASVSIGDDNLGNYLGSHISNARIVKGTCLYPSGTTFTPPAAPLTNVTNTKLLCCQSNTSATDALVSPSQSVNNGTVWRNYVTANNTMYNYDGTLAPGDGSTGFDGNLATRIDDWNGVYNSNYSYQLEFIPPSPISYSSSVEVYTVAGPQSPYNNEFFIDTGSGYGSAIAHVQNSWVTLASGSGSVSKIKTTADQNGTSWTAIRIDGIILIDGSTNSIIANGDAAATTFNPFNTDINTVRGQEGTYPTLNPLDMRASTALSNANLTVTAAAADWYLARSTQFITTGKYYWEFKWYGGAVTGSSGYQMGLKTPTSTLSAAAEQEGSYAFQYQTIYQTAGSTNSVVVSPGSTTPGDCVMFAYDADAGKMWFGVNGIWNDGANPALGTNSDWTSLPTTGLAPFAGTYNSVIKIDCNFGQKPFKFPPPDGFQSLNSNSLIPENVITRPDQYVSVLTFTGTGSGNGNQPIRFPFKPDLVITKQRTGTANSGVYDTVRGTNSKLYTSSTAAANTNSDAGPSSWDYRGLTLDDTGDDIVYNGATGVAWAWKAGGDKGTFNVDDEGYASASDVNMNVGALNSASYNTSEIWSGMMSGPTNSGVYTSLFDGTDGDAGGYEQPTDGNTLTFTPTGGITASTSIEIYVYQSSNTYSGSADITVNGTSIKTGAVQSALGTGAAGGYVNTGTKSLTTLTWSNPSGSNNDYRLMAIRVDGKILVDSDQTPPNIPSIAPSGCSVGTKQGFSIIKATGSSSGNVIAHGLGKVPKFVISKDMDNTRAWYIYHEGLGANYRSSFDNAASSSDSEYFGSGMTDTFITLKSGGSGGNNYNGADMIYYIWADVPGLQKFGMYSGNSDADGVFVECGFRPAILMIKNTAITSNWVIVDSKRDTSNPLTQKLYADYNGAENVSNPAGDGAAYNNIDFVSNGFKLRSANSWTNDSYDYIYAAWAEAPSFNLYGGQSNAR